MIDQKDIVKLERFVKGLSTTKEEKYIYSLFSKNGGSTEFKKYLSKEFNESLNNNSEKAYDISYLLDRVHHIIHKSENSKKQSITWKIYKWYASVAAVLILPMVLLGGMWYAKQHQKELKGEAPFISTLHAPLGSRISFSLPDGTAGWLNSGSSLEYSLPFCHNRKLTISGEAWFDVAHDDTYPFEVSAGDSKVNVLGTKFNLNAYPDEDRIEVVLEEGEITFSVPGRSKLVEMKPNERLVYRDNAINIKETEAAKYSGWKEGKLIFRGDSMKEVTRRIERWYNIEVVLVDDELKNHIIYGTFQDDSLEEVFKYLSMTSPMRYRIFERKILADGTWQKKKVLLYAKK